MIALPGIYWAKSLDGRIIRAWFPFGGIVEHFLSVDRAGVRAVPVVLRLQRNGRTTYHVLWPIFGWSTGTGGPSWKVWPLIGHKKWVGRYDRWYFLWPFFQIQKNELQGRTGEPGKRVDHLSSLSGAAAAAAWRSIAALWPFFGYSWDPDTGFWAWDGPWPLVRFMSPGTEDSATRWRVWPFYSYYEGDGADVTLLPLAVHQPPHREQVPRQASGRARM